ncbi:2Fe-2S iron-sulfur cluster binding domain-containing protein [Aromatoleum toluclasticum]|uniref:2Fe-2S iron-sulfur cluster-binding protein n=1 Tax=Aromatoleum toluclasticum TaxID=92003 RepID=UPI0003763175|nr:2Fe-2S iron-sulfur cluster binding domain-containing protein [Aromatoleum toluclasticum]MCC4114990.1 2Fe-2S iron-sulfur cluster binding domain-containing protein [Aromatoleum toluclasticum]
MSERFSVRIEDSGEVFNCTGEQNLLRAMEVLGRRGIPVGCRGGGCGVCKVRVTEGRFSTRKMSRACLSEEEERDGVVLACKVFATSDLSLRVVGGLRKALARPRY